MEGSYPVPYQKPTVAEIAADLEAGPGPFSRSAMPARLIDRVTGQPITDFSHPVATAIPDRGEGGAFGPVLL